MEGGQMKQFQLQTSYYPKCIKFQDCPLLNQLVAELTETFCTHYVEAPSDVMDNHLKHYLGLLQEVGGNSAEIEKDLQNTKLAKWRVCQKCLEESSTWMVDMFWKCHSDWKLWPQNNNAELIAITDRNIWPQEHTNNSRATKKRQHWSQM
jgi:hypothetical protein